MGIVNVMCPGQRKTSSNAKKQKKRMLKLRIPKMQVASGASKPVLKKSVCYD